MASKDSNAVVISLSIVGVVTLGFGIAWYFANEYKTELVGKIAESNKAEATSKTVLKGLEAERKDLQKVIGVPGTTDDVIADGKALIAKNAIEPSLASRPFSEVIESTAQKGYEASQAGVERLTQTYAKINELNTQVATHEQAMQAMKTSLKDKEEQLRKKEELHAKKLEEEEKSIDTKKSELRAEQDTYIAFVKSSEIEIENLNKEISRQRQALIVLRREKLKLEGSTFERADGSVTRVDLDADRCYVDLGTDDELRVGMAFNVYALGSREVGRTLNKREIKGRIEIIALLEDHLAEARIVSHKVTDPPTAGDFIYSSLFERGKKLQIAVVGLLEFDGNPGSDREEFRRLTSGAGIEVVIEVDDEANILGKNKELLTEADIASRITSETRFLVIGDPGDLSDPDEARRLISEKIESHRKQLIRAAENNGVYVLSLSSFLDSVNYSRKRLVNSGTSVLSR